MEITIEQIPPALREKKQFHSIIHSQLDDVVVLQTNKKDREEVPRPGQCYGK